MRDACGWGISIGCAIACLASIAAAEPPAKNAAPQRPPTGHFGYGLIETADGQPADIDFLLSNETCAVCHPRQVEEFQGSMHSAAHEDPLYRGFAEAARREAGDQIYAYCAACHAPVGVAAGIIPATPDDQLPREVKAGVTCDTCHHISALTGTEGPWKAEGNASFVLESGKVRFGPSEHVAPNRLHTDEKRAFFAKSEFCASCHTVIHPTNSLPIENTYGEWKASVYAQHGIQCQDCHMARVEDAVKVAESLKPVVRQGYAAQDGPMRQIFPHYFVGASVEADRLAQGPVHAKMAEARLRSAAQIELRAPAAAKAGREFQFDVIVRNIAAGHNLPTGVTELRQMWVDLRIVDRNQREVFRGGQLDEHGDFDQGAIWFGAVAADATGKPTLKPWEMTRFLLHRAVPPKGEVSNRVTVKLPPGATGPLTLDARLLYRSASPRAVHQFLEDKAFVPKITEMTAARATIRIE
jgi:Cytochrome c554 and c-prime